MTVAKALTYRAQQVVLQWAFLWVAVGDVSWDRAAWITVAWNAIAVASYYAFHRWVWRSGG